MSVRQSGSKHTSGKRDPIAELKARIKRIKSSLAARTTSKRGKAPQQQLLRKLEERLVKYQQNQNQFGNVYGNRTNDNPIGRGVSKNKPRKVKESIRDEDGKLKPGYTQTWDSESDETKTYKGFPGRNNRVETTNNETTVESKPKKKLQSNNGNGKDETPSPKKTLGTETKEQFLERTKNSPAGKAFGNSAAANEKRWAARQRYLDFLAKRKKKKNKKQ